MLCSGGLRSLWDKQRATLENSFLVVENLIVPMLSNQGMKAIRFLKTL